MKPHHYLAVTGTMGSGKTTAAKLLAKHLKFHLLEENFGENAFLSRFYKEMKRWAFHSQTFFLMEKTAQLLEAGAVLRSKATKDFPKTRAIDSRFCGNDKIKGIVQDTPIYQDVFSYAKAQNILGNMDDSEWRLYQKIFRSFLPHMPKPNYIIYLKTSLPKVKERISTRHRDFESQVPEGYLELLEMLNEAWMKKETNGAKIITVDTDELNLVRSRRDIKKFLGIIKKSLLI